MFRAPFHLCHCMNVFPGTELQAKVRAFTGSLPKIRAMIPGAEGAPFAAGIWIDANSASMLTRSKKVRDFAEFVHSLGFYSFTANAFPYGTFHDAAVKTAVYTPDWSTQDRMEYTKAVAGILAELMPNEELPGSISTLPAGYKAHFPDSKIPQMVRNISETADYLRRLRDRTGKTIRLAFEMEPDCLWEAPEEFAEFYRNYFQDNELSEFIGVCYDTCHQELLGTAPGAGIDTLLAAGIRIPKIQLSAAIQAPDKASKDTLEQSFQDRVYLHQTRVVNEQEILYRWDDLPDALRQGDRELPWKTHFHIPVFTEELPGGMTPAKAELKAVLKKLKEHPEICPALEIETYSYQVLPEFSKSATPEDSMAREMIYILNELNLK